MKGVAFIIVIEPPKRIPDVEVVTTATWSATSGIPSASYAFHAVDASRVVRLGARS